MKKIINAPENYVDDMLKGIYTQIRLNTQLMISAATAEQRRSQAR